MPASREALHISITSSEEEVFIPLLASRSFHLPGNNWKQDWIQWFQNNHILFGICLHHRLHPLEGWERCLLLAASVSFGLVATNIHLIYQYQLDELEMIPDEELVSYKGETITLTRILLWTVGGLAHSIFDMAVWHIMACACCHPGGRWGDKKDSKRFKDCGSYALIPLIVAMLVFSIFLVLLRATNPEEYDDDTTTTTTDGDMDIHIDDWRSFAFLSQYAIELGLAWFVCFPIVGSIAFSGILGCGGRIPVLGGRPRDYRRVQQGIFGFYHHPSSPYSSF